MLTVKAFSFNPVEENTYILYNEKRQCCIIDPGCYFPEERGELENFIENNDLKPQLLLNTHCHLDHVFGNKFVAETWNLKLHIDEKDGFAISGDVLFNMSVGRTDLPGGDFETLVNSIQTQLFTLPDETKIYSGHGPMTTIGFEKMNNPFVKLY